MGLRVRVSHDVQVLGCICVAVRMWMVRALAVWGGSYGGYLTALALARASDMFAAGVDLHGVHDWNLEMDNWNPDYDATVTQEARRLAWESSPAGFGEDVALACAVDAG